SMVRPVSLASSRVPYTRGGVVRCIRLPSLVFAPPAARTFRRSLLSPHDERGPGILATGWIFWRTQFPPKNAQLGLLRDTEADLVPADCHHGDADSIADDNLFAYLATQDQHRSYSFKKSLWHTPKLFGVHPSVDVSHSQATSQWRCRERGWTPNCDLTQRI